MRRLPQTHLPDPALESVRQDLTAIVSEIQQLPFASMRVVQGVVLDDGVETPVSHGLGRPPVWVRESAPRGPMTAGIVEEVRTGGIDRRKSVLLKASGWGASITVDVLVA